MTSSLLDAPAARLPRVSSAPKFFRSSGDDAIDLADIAGLHLDPWQQHVLRVGLGERPDGKWSAFEVGLLVPRQNGKGAILEARELAGLFLFGERLILHSAHEMKTAVEGFIRIKALIQETPELDAQVANYYQSNEKTEIRLKSGARLRFVARSSGSGRGFSGDCVILDEAYALSNEMLAALLPTLSARPNPQLWYASSAGMDSSDVLARVRERGIKGDKRLAFFDWSAPEGCDLDDPEMWALANPALGIRIPEDFIEAERSAMSDEEFARERLGIWRSSASGRVISPEMWAKVADADSKAQDPVVFAADVTPDRSGAAIAMAGTREDGLWHVEVIEARAGTEWVAPRLAELVAKWRPAAVVIDSVGPVASLLPALSAAGITPEQTGTRELAQACGAFYDAVEAKTVRHRDQDALNAALTSARKRPLGDAWAWARKGEADISPLVAATLALHGVAAGLGAPKQKALTRVKGRVHSY